MTHGTRATYQSGCACTPCRAAEATYRTQLRQRKAKGLPLLGMLVRAVEARRRIRQLKLEGYPTTRIAAMAGWADHRSRHIQFDEQARIRLSTLLRIRRVAAFAMLEGADVPDRTVD